MNQKKIMAAIFALEAGPGKAQTIVNFIKLDAKAISEGVREYNKKYFTPPRLILHAPHAPFKEYVDPDYISDFRAFVEETVIADRRPDRRKDKTRRRQSGASFYPGNFLDQESFNRILEFLGHHSIPPEVAERVGENIVIIDLQVNAALQFIQNNFANKDLIFYVNIKKKKISGILGASGRNILSGASPGAASGEGRPSPESPHDYPYGIFDIPADTDHAYVGEFHDVWSFTIASIKGWWFKRGTKIFDGSPPRTNIVVNNAKGDAFKTKQSMLEVQNFADEIQGEVMIKILPPNMGSVTRGAKRLFTINAGDGKTGYETKVDFIGEPEMGKLVTIFNKPSKTVVAVGREVSDAETVWLNMKTIPFFDTWNYAMSPIPKSS
ncbi:MAG: hypothetical protein LBR53_08925 [Deltaproteobacteria bacterium]|nr:hypothetical protein [Deltaproteobacteria bacterium]